MRPRASSENVARKRRSLPSHSRLEIPHEVPLVHHVGPPPQRVHADGQVQRRRHRADCLERDVGCSRAQFAGQFQRQVAAERVTGKRHCADAIPLDQLPNHVQRIVGQSRVVQAPRQLFGAAAIPLIQTHDVPSLGPGLVGDASHVVGVTRALEAVQQDDGRTLVRSGVPMTVGQDACIRCDVEEPRHGGWQRGKMASSRPRKKRLPVAADEERPVFGRSERVSGDRSL